MKSKRTVVEVTDRVHGEIRRLAVLNDLRIYMLANALLEEILSDDERVKAVVKRLRIK